MFAANATWDGGGADPNFSTALNWASDTVPAANDTLTFDGITRLGPNNDLAAGIAFNGITFASTAGAFTLGGNQITLHGDISDNVAVLIQNISLALALDASRNIAVTDNGFLSIGGVISGAGFGITKTGNGTLSLTASNSFSGPVTVNAGVLNVSSDGQLGAIPGSATPGQIVIDGNPNGGTVRATTSFTLNANRGIAVGPTSGSGSGTIETAVGQTLTYGGAITSNGGIGGLTKSGYGTLLLTGTNNASSTYTGPTVVSNGTLLLNFANTTATGGLLSADSALTVGGGNAGFGSQSFGALIVTGKASTPVTQSFINTKIALGNNVIRANTGGGTGATAILNLGTLTHNTGGVVSFPVNTVGTTNTNVGSININPASEVTNGILGGWATVGVGSNNVGAVTVGTDWAAIDGSGKIVTYAGYTDIANSAGVIPNDPTKNVRITAPAPASGVAGVVTLGNSGDGNVTDVNSLLWSGAGTLNAVTLNFGTAGSILRLGKYGGIFRTDQGSTGGNSGAPTDIGTTQNFGILTAGGAPNTPGEIVFTNNSSSQTSGGMNVEVGIADNGTGTVTVIKTGPGPMKLRASNSYTGGTYVLSGRLQTATGENGGTANNFPFGTGPVTVVPGGQAFLSAAATTNIANEFFIAGLGTNAEPSGAMRLSTLEVSGTIHLMGDSRLDNTPGSGGTQSTLISGQITGNFGVEFGGQGGNSTNAGTITISNINNNYLGDTKITAATSTYALRLGNDEVIPNGFGRGNVIISGTASQRAVLDLNGQGTRTTNTERINGLSSAGTAANDIVTNDGTAPATLELGDYDQTATFAGIVQNGASTTALTKVGNGIQTLTAANTFTGDANINAGALAITGSLASIGNVNANATASTAGELNGTGSVGKVTLSANNGSHKASIAPGSSGAQGAIGTLSMANLTVNGGDLRFDLATPGTSDAISASGTATFDGTSSVATISPSPTGASGTYTVVTAAGGITYANGGTPTLSSPANTRNTYGLNTSSSASQIFLTVVNNAKSLTWTGATNSTWDIVNTQNWTDGAMAEKFFNADSVTFPNGPTNRDVSLSVTVQPGAVTFNNSTGNDYTISGPGNIAGAATLTKNGTGAATISTNNTFTAPVIVNAGSLALTGTNSSTGTIAVNGGALILGGNTSFASASITAGGTLQIGNGGSTGSMGTGSIANGGVLVVNRSNAITLANGIADGPGGAGTIIKTGAGTLTLSGANTYSGPTNILAGTVLATNSNGLGQNPGGAVNISAGAAFDLAGDTTANDAQYTNKQFVIAGTGPGGAGALVNTGGVAQQNAFQNILLSADATIGGTNRFDVRLGVAQLDLAGFTLTKSGAMLFNLASANVTDGNILVSGGSIGFEGNTNIVDNASGKNITLTSGRTVQLTDLSGNVSRPIITQGTATFTNAGNGNSTLRSNITLGGTATLTNSNGGNMIFTGNIGETGGTRNLTKAGTTTVILAGANNYSGTTTISGGTLQIGGGTTSGTLGAGPVVNNSNLAFNRSDTLTVANANSGTGSLFHSGSGTTLLTGSLIYTGVTQVNNGRLQLGTNLTTSPTVNINNTARLEIASPRGKVLNTQNLNIASGATLDMNENDAIVDYTGSSPFATIQSQIISGYAGGAWNGAGITSTAAANNNAVPGNHITALGYGEALAVFGGFPATFSGQTINDDAVLIRYTLSGDVNLDGSVDTVDFNLLAANFSQSGKNWTDGDFNYDGVVDTVDFSLLASNFSQTLPASTAAAASIGSVGALVPEPTFAGLATIIGGMLIARRRRRRT